MKILKLRLENFQGVKEFEVEPNGESCSVYGDNGTGKTTIYNAFTWLMYGKPSTSEKSYTPKTTGSHGLNHVVEMTALLDNGAVMVLRKDYHEVYKTMKGSAQAILAGHTTDYSVDGVPVNETQFKRTLTDIYANEDLAKILTSYDYFLDNMKVADRRQILLQVCGDVDFMTVIGSTPELADLPGILRKPGNTEAMYSVEEYQKIASREKTLTDRDLKDIPTKINEAEKAKPDISGVSEKAVRGQIERLREARRQAEAERSAADSTAETTIRKQIAELESRRSTSEAAHIKAESDKNRGAYERISNLRYMKSEIEMAVMRMEQEQQQHRNEITRLEAARKRLLAEYDAEAAKEWNGDTVCPTCKRPLPPEQVAVAREAFNIAQAEKLEQINQRGMTQCNAGMITAEQEKIAALDEQIRAKKDEKAGVEEQLAVAQMAVVTTVDYKNTEEYKKFTAEIEAQQDKLKDMRAAAQEANAVLIGRLRELDTQIEAENRKLASLSFVEQQDKRIAELEAQEKELAAKFEGIQYGLHLCDLYTRKQASLLDDKINSRFKTLRFRLFIEQQNGGIADDCEALVPCGDKLVPFKSANNASRINAGLEVIDTLAAHYGVELPIFLDNAESVTKLRKMEAQLIRLVVSEPDKTLRFEKGGI